MFLKRVCKWRGVSDLKIFRKQECASDLFCCDWGDAYSKIWAYLMATREDADFYGWDSNIIITFCQDHGVAGVTG